MSENENKRETGSRKPEEVKDEKSGQSDSMNRNAKGNVAVEKTTGAGPGVAAHSKDAKVPQKKS